MFKRIGSLKITLILLFTIALSSIVGTLIIQGQSDQFYIQKYGSKAGVLILSLEADNFFNSIYYNILLFCLGLNLFLCTINSFKLVLLKDIRKFAVFVLHFGVLVVFAGALTSKIIKQEQRYTLFPRDKIVLHDKNAEIVFREFSLDYHPGSLTPKEYTSRVELFENGAFKSEYNIRVNHPLKYRGISFYQSSFSVLADVEIIVKHNNKVLWEGLWEHGKPLEIFEKKPLRFEMTYFFPDAYIDKHGGIALRSYNLGNAAMLVSMYKKEKIVYEQWMLPNDQDKTDLILEKEIFSLEVKKIKPVYGTIIQSIEDPGLSFVMSGFSLMFLGMLLLLFKKRY